MANWEAYRREFPILARKNYMNTCSLGPLSRRARAGVEEFMAEWDDRGAAAWYDAWMAKLADLRERFARLIHASPEEVALAPNVSVALGSIASAINYGLKPKVVVSELDFPTIAYQWMVKPDVQVDFVKSPDGVRVPPEAFAKHLDVDTGLVATSHVMFTSGYIQDLDALADLAHEQAAYLLVDAYQSAGQVPIDVAKTDVDILVTGGLKWLLGGPGAVFMFVRRDVAEELEPTTTGWFANSRQFEFDPRNFEFHRDARRYETGTPSVGAVYAAISGLDIILEIGVEAIRRRTASLVDRLYEEAGAKGFTLRTPKDPEERAAIVMVERRDPAGAVAHLGERSIIVDSRGSRVRISPFFYNTEEEVDAVVHILGETR